MLFSSVGNVYEWPTLKLKPHIVVDDNTYQVQHTCRASIFLEMLITLNPKTVLTPGSPWVAKPPHYRNSLGLKKRSPQHASEEPANRYIYLQSNFSVFYYVCINTYLQPRLLVFYNACMYLYSRLLVPLQLFAIPFICVWQLFAISSCLTMTCTTPVFGGLQMFMVAIPT